MSSKTAYECVQLFVDRFTKLLTGEVVPGRNECDQPYDSEWEREFEWVLAKGIPDFFTLRNQVPFGRFRADYAFECSRTGRIWIVEFDGKTFHNPERDRQRDMIIFREHPRVQAIVRVDASTGQLEPNETRAMLSMLLPECFRRQFTPFYDWKEESGVFTARIFDLRHDQDCWMSEGGLQPGAPMVDLRIEMKGRST